MDTPILNAHNKEEYPPMHTEGKNTPQRLKLLVLMFGLLVLCGCGHRGTADIAFPDSIVCGIIEDEQQSDSISNEILLPPEPEWKSVSKNKRRELTDSEIANLSFDGYQFDGLQSAVYKEMLGSWKEYSNKHRPYYSVVTCPSCGYNLLVVFGSSPNEYWQSLSGQEGWFAICTHCRKVLDFEIVAMN